MKEGARKQGRGIGRISDRAAAWLAWALCALALTSIICAVALAILNRSDVAAAAIFPLALTVSAMVGRLVASRRPENPVG